MYPASLFASLDERPAYALSLHLHASSQQKKLLVSIGSYEKAGIK
jgi:hypothetical protein